MDKTEVKKEVLQEVEIILYEGGEIPEVRFWNSYFYLTSPPPEGLGLSLTEKDIELLKKAVIDRYLLIIERDLTPDFIDKPFYRGVSRVIVNIQRLNSFLENTGLKEKHGDIIKRKIKIMFKKFKEGLKKQGKNLNQMITKEELKEFKKVLEEL